jgi:hypothetical protein
MIVTHHKELPEGVEMPKGYRLIEAGERIPVGCLKRNGSEPNWRATHKVCIGCVASGPDCIIVPDYSTGLWKEDAQ